MKRALDFLVASVVLIASAPLLAVAAVAVVLTDGRPVLFAQERAGRDGRPIRIRKLRTMRVHSTAPEEVGQVGGDHPLVTAPGRVLRRLKLDELPQLLSVLSGSMSLVGPRPALVSDLTTYDDVARRRLEVTPGITGWAQVNGNTALTWPQRISLDVWYVDHHSLMLDLRILLMTVQVLVKGEQPDNDALAQAEEHAARLRGDRAQLDSRTADTPRRGHEA